MLRPLTPSMLRPLAPFRSDTWVGLYLRTAGVGLLILLFWFGAYEVVERAYLLDRLTVPVLFALHWLRGVVAGITLGTWAFVNIWRTRRRFDEAFQRAHEELEEQAEQRTRALRNAQEFSDRLFDAITDRLVVLDTNGRVAKVNRVVTEQLGSQVLGEPCDQVPGVCRPTGSGCTAMTVLREGKAQTGFELTDRTGRILSVSAYPVPHPESGQEAVIVLARDVTEAKELEVRARAQEKQAALGVLAAGIAHDIGNPLASMASELEMLEHEDDLTQVRESLGVLHKQVMRISRTLREMTDFARRRGEERTRVRIEAAVEDALRMVRHDKRARRIQLSSRLSPGLPDLSIVEDHLAMVLVNLLINAFDALPGGGKVQVSAEGEVGGGVKVLVRDDGPGMAPEVLKRALEPLYTTKPHGTGLGLTVSAEVLKDSGGSLELASAPGEGTTVTLHFPSSATYEGPVTQEVTRG